MAYGFFLQAEYESGLVLTEDENDHSPYDAGRNVFHAIAGSRASDSGHGRMVRFSLIGPEHTYTIDWRPLWEVDNPRPIYYRKMHKTDEINDDGGVLVEGEAVCEAHYFGFQYIDADGKNVQEIQEIR